MKSEVPDRAVLTALYHRMNGDEWTNNANWLREGPLSTWFGETANSFGNVIEVKLARNNLQGTVPAELYHLASFRN